MIDIERMLFIDRVLLLLVGEVEIWVLVIDFLCDFWLVFVFLGSGDDKFGLVGVEDL